MTSFIELKLRRDSTDIKLVVSTDEIEYVRQLDNEVKMKLKRYDIIYTVLRPSYDLLKSKLTR